MPIVTGSYQNYQNEAASNQLTYVGGGGSETVDLIYEVQRYPYCIMYNVQYCDKT